MQAGDVDQRGQGPKGAGVGVGEAAFGRSTQAAQLGTAFLPSMGCKRFVQGARLSRVIDHHHQV